MQQRNGTLSFNLGNCAFLSLFKQFLASLTMKFGGSINFDRQFWHTYFDLLNYRSRNLELGRGPR